MNKLVTVTNKNFISNLKKEDVTLVYPLRFFSVGYEEYFDIKDIDDFVLVNRILNDDEINKLEETLLSSNIKGIMFDDLGILDVVKDIDITKILILDHISNNVSSINSYLEYVDSIVVSSDLSEEEIRNIVKNVNKKVVIYTFGLKGLMYSRRNLLDNYEMYYKLDKEKVIDSHINNNFFKVIESDYGTKVYAYPYYDGTSLLDLDNVLYFWYDPILLDINNIRKVLNNDLSNIDCSRIFLDKKTVYKVGDLDA